MMSFLTVTNMMPNKQITLDAQSTLLPSKDAEHSYPPILPLIKAVQEAQMAKQGQEIERSDENYTIRTEPGDNKVWIYLETPISVGPESEDAVDLFIVPFDEFMLVVC